MWSMVDDRVKRALHEHPEVKALRAEIESGIREGTLTATVAAERVLSAFGLDPA